jgi:RES domain-containing protein
MGIDDEAFAQEERGWRDPGKWICRECVGEQEFLRRLIQENTSSSICSYCQSHSRRAAPLSALMDALLRAVKYSFEDPTHAGHPWDSACPIDYQCSEEVFRAVLDSDALDWSDNLIADVAASFVNTGWVEAAEGEWMGSHGHELYRWSWEAFTRTVKHQSRFHFHNVANVDRNCGDQFVSSSQIFGFLGDVFNANNMVKSISVNTELLRVRRGNHGLTAQEAGPPPNAKATSGRMNPAGIPYLYLAFDQRTALAEARAVIAEDVTLSRWQSSRELQVLDLTHLPQCMSIFEGRDTKQDQVIFLSHYVADMRKPVGEDNLAEIEYVPTQLVCEYLAQVFSSEGKPLDGLIYPSALTTGKNLVLFPERGQRYSASSLHRFGMVKFQSAEVIKV